MYPVPRSGLSTIVSLSARSIPCAALAVGLLCLMARPVAAGDVLEAPSAQGMRVYRDPATGVIGAPPPGAFVESAPRALAVQEGGAEPLIAEPVQGPAGGVKVNLRGRYRAAVVRHAGPEGVGQNECVETGNAAR
jgi:hypothetical protein